MEARLTSRLRSIDSHLVLTLLRLLLRLRLRLRRLRRCKCEQPLSCLLTTLRVIRIHNALWFHLLYFLVLQCNKQIQYFLYSVYIQKEMRL